MCGIVGYVGKRDAIPLLVSGLEKLEYRGYDSSGVAQPAATGFKIYRAEGKLSNLRAQLTKADISLESSANQNSEIRPGIGHTRWATHGRPTETNAHPHVAGKVCVVHNGIIENYVALREQLQASGSVFSSETDSEIAAHLINSYYDKSGDLLESVKTAIKDLEGSYALVVISLDNPDQIVVAKNATPVILGLGEGENFVASDIPAILEHTRQVVILEDGDIANVTSNSVTVYEGEKEIERAPMTVTWDPITAEKGGFRHFMLKEIHEQPQVLAETFRGRIDREDHEVILGDINFSDEELKAIERVTIVACGTAWHAGLVMKYFIEQFAHVPVEVDYGSEFRYRTPLINEKTLFIVVSQSGETADTLGSLMLAAEKGAKTLAICNVVGSSMSRKAGNVLYTHAGPEISVASTKAFTTQLVAGYLFALKLGIARGVLSDEDVDQRFEELTHLPALVTSALEVNRQMEKIARKYGRSEDWLFLGRGALYPIALEGALKLKEVSYVHAEGYPAGEMKHGPIALITDETPVVVVFGKDGINYEKAMSNLQEVESRGGRVIAITDVETEEIKNLAWEVVALGEMPALMLPIVLTIPLQLLAYHVAVYRGTDVDQPRNLAKSVTVE